MSKSFYVEQARRCNRLVISHKVAGDLSAVGMCKQMRNLWMGEARRA